MASMLRRFEPRPITMLNYRKLAAGETTVLKLVGRIDAPHLEELRKLIAETEGTVKLDLSEVTLVDIDVVRFLGNQELRGVQLANCSRYVRAWIQREQTSDSTQRERGGLNTE